MKIEYIDHTDKLKELMKEVEFDSDDLPYFILPDWRDFPIIKAYYSIKKNLEAGI